MRKGDLEIDSPYNTYRVRGLPPGPIASPGRASIEAALQPADVPYLYFVSRNDGTHVFATTLAEHNRNVRAMAEAEQSSRKHSRVHELSAVSPLQLLAQHVEVRARGRAQQAEHARSARDVDEIAGLRAARRTGRRTSAPDPMSGSTNGLELDACRGRTGRAAGSSRRAARAASGRARPRTDAGSGRPPRGCRPSSRWRSRR